MRTILADAANLPPVMPERNLWIDIESSIQRSQKNILPFPVARKRILQLVVAAAAVLIVVMLGDTPTKPEPGKKIVTHVQTPEEIERAQLEAEYALAKDSLMNALDARKDELSPDMLTTIEENLNIIENAVVDINRALATNPNDPQLERMLHAAYQSEVTLLQHAVQMENDDH